MKVSILAVQISFILSLSCNHQQSKQETTGEKNKIDTGITGEAIGKLKFLRPA